MDKRLRVLVVEDSEDDAELLLRELRRGGYDPISERVDTAEAMSEALQGREWHIVLADYVMPRFSGLAALELLQAKGIDLPFVVVSGQIGEDVAVRAMKAGASDYILKGHLGRLIPAVRRELREADVRRERRKAEQERDRLMEQLRDVNEQLVVRSLAAQEAMENERRMQEELRKTRDELESRVRELAEKVAKADGDLRRETEARKRAEEGRNRLLQQLKEARK
ncbi:MAG: response regulator [Chloroflexi bacterium]|nr:response regulator [Chloroflexota bacterium]